MKKSTTQLFQETVSKESQKRTNNKSKLIASFNRLKEAGLITKTEYTFPLRNGEKTSIAFNPKTTYTSDNGLAKL